MMILQMVITILMITAMIKMISMIVIIMMIFMIKIIMMLMETMILIMIAVVIRQLYATQCNLGELEITAGHQSMTRRKRSLIESNCLQLIYHFLNLTTKVDYVSLFHENIDILNHNPNFLSTFRSFGKDIMEH